MIKKKIKVAIKIKRVGYNSQKRKPPEIKELDVWLKEFMHKHDDVLRELAKR